MSTTIITEFFLINKNINYYLLVFLIFLFFLLSSNFNVFHIFTFFLFMRKLFSKRKGKLLIKTEYLRKVK